MLFKSFITVFITMQIYQEGESHTNTKLSINGTFLQRLTELLDDYLTLLVHRPEFPRSHPSLRFEHPVEVGQVVEPAVITYFRDVAGRVNQLTGSVTELNVNYIVAEGAACTELEETAERRRCHPDQLRQVTLTDLFSGMSVYVVLHFLDSPAFRRLVTFGE